jgi:hypothetical protein
MGVVQNAFVYHFKGFAVNQGKHRNSIDESDYNFKQHAANPTLHAAKQIEFKQSYSLQADIKSNSSLQAKDGFAWVTHQARNNSEIERKTELTMSRRHAKKKTRLGQK